MKTIKKQIQKIKGLLLMVFLIIPAGMKGEVVEGVSVHVCNGEQFVMMVDDGIYVKVNLFGIDAPDKDHSCFSLSKKELALLLDGQKLAVDVKGKNEDGLIGEVLGKKKGNINLHMLRNGMAWKKQGVSSAYRHAENIARNKRAGVWNMNK